MKRFLSLTLALVMVLGAFTGVFAAEKSAEDFAVDFLVKNEILKGAAEDGDLMLDKGLERREAVVLLSRLLGEEEEAEEFADSPSWEDAGVDPYYLPFLAWAEANEYFVGDDEGKFNPREEITGQEYVLVLQRALGYEDAYGHDAWKAALEEGKKLGILKDLELEDKEVITRAQMALMTFNALSAELADGSMTLAEFLGIEMPEEKELKAEVLDTENLAEVVVELSNAKLVKNKEALTNPANYRISDSNVKVYNVDIDGDDVILTLVPYGRVDEAQKDFDVNKNVLVKGKKYDLTIRNIDPAINKTYKGILAGDNEIPAVENVEFMGTYGIKVTTSEPISNPEERNFRLDSRTSMRVEQYGREIILTPYHGRAFDKDAVELTIDQLNDFARYTSVRTVESMELSTDDALPKVEAAYRSGSKLTVVFDRDVYHDSIGHYESRRDLGNVSFVERRVTFYAEDSKKVDTNVVEYTFARDIPRSIEVEIEGVANHFNKAMEKEVIVPVEYKDDYAPVVISSTGSVKVTKDSEAELKELAKDEKEYKKQLDAGFPVKTQEMTIIFDKDIDEFVEYQKENGKVSAADLVDHFVLYELDITRRGKAAADEVEINVEEVKNDRIKLSFNEINVNNKDRDYDYILEVRDFTDSNRNRMDRDYLDFQVVRIKNAFNITKLSIGRNTYFNREGVEIVLEFNDYVNKEEASNARNYYLDGKLDVDEAIVERDGKTVALVVYDTTVEKLEEKYEVLEISPRVQDLDKDATVADRFWSLATKKAITDPADVKGAIKAAEKAITEIVELLASEDGITLENKAKVEKARELVVAAKKLDKTVEFDNEDKLVEAEVGIAKLVAEEAIAQLPKEISLEDKDAVEEARELVEEAKKLDSNVEIKNLSVLEKAETTIENLENDKDGLAEAIKKAEAAITLLPSKVTLDDKDAVEAARKLVEEAIKLDKDVEIEGIQILVAAETKIVELEAAELVEKVKKLNVTVSERTSSSDTDKGGVNVSLGWKAAVGEEIASKPAWDVLESLEITLYRNDKELVTNVLTHRHEDTLGKASPSPFNYGTEGNNEWAWDRGAYELNIDDEPVKPDTVVVKIVLKGSDEVVKVEIDNLNLGE